MVFFCLFCFCTHFNRKVSVRVVVWCTCSHREQSAVRFSRPLVPHCRVVLYVPRSQGSIVEAIDGKTGKIKKKQLRQQKLTNKLVNFIPSFQYAIIGCFTLHKSPVLIVIKTSRTTKLATRLPS